MLWRICHNRAKAWETDIAMKLSSPRRVFAWCLTAAWAVFLSSATLAGKEGYYRWKDDSGEFHFTQQPPVGRQYEFVETRAGASVVSNGGDDSDEIGSPEAAPAAAAPQRMEVLPEKDPAVCAQAKENLLTLEKNGARIRVTDENGNSRLLNPEEMAVQKQRAQDAINIHCA